MKEEKVHKIKLHLPLLLTVLMVFITAMPQFVTLSAVVAWTLVVIYTIGGLVIWSVGGLVAGNWKWVRDLLGEERIAKACKDVIEKQNNSKSVWETIKRFLVTVVVATFTGFCYLHGFYITSLFLGCSLILANLTHYQLQIDLKKSANK